MSFLRVVEVFPPLFPKAATDGPPKDSEIDRFVDSIRSIRVHADIVLVSSLKRADVVMLPPVHSAAILEERAGVKAAPVIVVRRMTRDEFDSTVLESLALGLDAVMLAWGDPDPLLPRVRSPEGHATLSEAIARAKLLAKRAGRDLRVLSPVDLRTLSTRPGGTIVSSRLAAGADTLLAQPPTTDAGVTFEEHAAAVGMARLKEKVMLSVFPFFSAEDVTKREAAFGWRLSEEVHRAAEQGADALVGESRRIVGRLRTDGFPGVYLSTRGDPSIAERILSQA
ncbi:MAG: hypothetical protein HY247_01000 [archaeon]|nr:MAG: hypothetical protein HY247_01000 [archaeon]